MGRIRRVKHWKPTLAILMALSASFAVADDFKTTKGKEYKNATVSRVEPNGIVIKFKGGIVKILFTELPKDVQLRFGYDTNKIEAEQAGARAAEEKRIEEQKAAERERAEKEKGAEAEHAEKEKKATADLNRLHEQFKSSEQSALQTYESAAKGTVSGQVFVSTQGGENFKLGAVQVGLFARDAIDILLAGLKKYADYKIQNDFFDHVYYSGAFYFAYFQFPIQTAETDADGKFAIEVPKTGRFVIAAQAQRSVGDHTEHYYWLQPVSPESGQRIQNLSNNNLTSTTGTSSLVHTEN